MAVAVKNMRIDSRGFIAPHELKQDEQGKFVKPGVVAYPIGAPGYLMLWRTEHGYWVDGEQIAVRNEKSSAPDWAHIFDQLEHGLIQALVANGHELTIRHYQRLKELESEILALSQTEHPQK